MPSRPEGPCGRLARFRRAEEQIKKRLDRDFAALCIGQGAVLAVFRILWRLTSARAGASEYETADQLGTAERKGLRDVSPIEKPSRSTCASPRAPMKSAAW